MTVHVLPSLCHESPEIKRGSRAQKIWKYQYRLNRLDRYAKARHAANPNLTMVQSMQIGALFCDTFEHMEALGVVVDDDGNLTDTKATANEFRNRG
jgi:hypothetical protein